MCGTDLNEGNLYYTVIKGGNMKTHGHDRDTNQPLWRLEKKKKTHEKFLDDVSAWAELCDNHNNLLLIFLLGFKGVFHIILSHSVYCTSTSAGDECSGDSSCRVVQCVYCDWKDFDNLEKGLCNASIGVCSALYNWIQHRTPHTWDWGWIMHYQWSHLQLLYSGAARDMARK